MRIEVKRLVRKLAGAHTNCPIEVVKGSKAPTLEGSSWHYTNRSGEYIRHPSAYSRRGWSSLVYRNSTLRVEVGADWLEARFSMTDPVYLRDCEYSVDLWGNGAVGAAPQSVQRMLETEDLDWQSAMDLPDEVQFAWITISGRRVKAYRRCLTAKTL